MNSGSLKILILSDPNLAHTIKWTTALAERGNQILLFGLSKLKTTCYNDYKNIQVYSFGFDHDLLRERPGYLKKLKYLQALKVLKEKIKEFQPDILHSHFATSYGLLGALSRKHPFIISVWGEDVFDFPNRSFLHKFLLKYNLAKADKILSTSNFMANQTKKFTDQDIIITPFGIDLKKFKKLEVKNIFKNDDIVLGTIKALEKKYGIEYLIKAFKKLKDRFPNLPLKLVIVGGGTYQEKLQYLTRDLNIGNDVHFTGRIDYDNIPTYHNMLDIAIYPSINESETFGVSILESSACEKPVIASKIGGLPEVIDEGVTGLLVEAKNTEGIADAIEKLILDNDLMIKMGKAGRERVYKFYNFEKNLDQMVNIYSSIL